MKKEMKLSAREKICMVAGSLGATPDSNFSCTYAPVSWLLAGYVVDTDVPELGRWLQERVELPCYRYGPLEFRIGYSKNRDEVFYYVIHGEKPCLMKD